MESDNRLYQPEEPPKGQMVETERPLQLLYVVDLIVPFPHMKNGNVGFLIIMDHFTKFTFLTPLKKFVRKPIVEYLKNEIFLTPEANSNRMN